MTDVMANTKLRIFAAREVRSIGALFFTGDNRARHRGGAPGLGQDQKPSHSGDAAPEGSSFIDLVAFSSENR
jgi:hypothetical protein